MFLQNLCLHGNAVVLGHANDRTVERCTPTSPRGSVARQRSVDRLCDLLPTNIDAANRSLTQTSIYQSVVHIHRVIERSIAVIDHDWQRCKRNATDHRNGRFNPSLRNDNKTR
jgi:methylphosphotriester-DNA--protein-cysteine methyltransferase